MIIDIKLKKIYYLDSLNINNNDCVINVVKKGLLSCNINDAKDWNVIALELPKQSNNYDCGVYVCLVLRLLSEKLNINDCTSFTVKDIELFRTHMLNEFNNDKLINLKLSSVN